MKTKVVTYNGFKYRIADGMASKGMAQKGDYTLSITGILYQYDSQCVIWLPGCPKILESTDPVLRGVLPDLQPTKRQVWLNMNNGKFSNSWVKGEDEYVQKVVDEQMHNPKDGWKLIEYTCPNDDDFQLYDLMKIVTNIKEKKKKKA